LRIVFKIGGHLLEMRQRTFGIPEYIESLKKIYDKGHKLAIIVGGGENAREYVEAARSLGADETSCDQMGIEVTRLNAQLFILGLGGEAYPTPPRDIFELREALGTGRIVVLGGLTPGHSTDAVAALVSEVMKTDLLLRLTDVDGVYTDNPKTNPKAKKIDVITSEELLQMTLSKRYWAGGYELLDPIAIKIIERSKIRTRIIDGTNPKNLERALEEEKIGTLITS